MTVTPATATYRPAVEADLAEILAIYNHAIETTTAVYSYQPHTLEMRREWYAAKQREGHPVLVAERGGQVIAFGALGPFRAWPGYKYTVENSIYVAEPFRGQGVGKLLLRPLIEAARRLEMHAVIAGIDASNVASVHLHTSFGFHEVAHFREVGYKFGRWLDLKFLELLLETPLNPVDG
jgi:phosphinothricin acetyltransferase